MDMKPTDGGMACAAAFPGSGLNSSLAARSPIALVALERSSGHAGSGSGSTIEETKAAGDPPTKKQKRNKPTLSCQECVERKTKCDRGRPNCLACVKRSSECRYTHVATVIASSDHGVNGNARYIGRPSSKKSKQSPRSPSSTAASPTTSLQLVTSPGVGLRSLTLSNGTKTFDRRESRSSTGSAPFLLSNVSYSRPAPSNVFGIGSEHPFANYWTCQGGLPEVMGVLPSKDQADILIAKYFEVVDPVYPMINRRTFYADYERFWAKGVNEKYKSDAAMLALHLVMYAMGTQFIEVPSYTERAQTAEFYVSASNQALRISSYLSHLSTRTVQAMVLICYFLMNDNHASDAWVFAGIVLRQAYAMGLNRDPDIIVPHASAAEKQQRRKLWQAVMFQDTFLTVLLKLPPTATHSDVSVDSLTEDPEPSGSSNSNDTSSSSNARIINQMSISAIAFSPSAPEPPPPPPPVSSLPDPYYDPVTAKDDVSYIRSMWQLANLVQENLCSPLSLSLPLFSSPRHRASLLSSFRSTHRNFPPSLTLLDYTALQQLAVTQPRRVRQNLFLTSNYYHCLMVLQANVNEAAGVQCNVKGALEAAHEAIWAFFKLWGLFESEAGVWWVFQHRAFEEALMIANLLSTHAFVDGTLVMDPLFMKCKDDVQRMLQILENGSGSMEMQKTRTNVLRSVFDGMGR